jgi:hypothetical protein
MLLQASFLQAECIKFKGSKGYAFSERNEFTLEEDGFGSTEFLNFGTVGGNDSFISVAYNGVMAAPCLRWTDDYVLTCIRDNRDLENGMSVITYYWNKTTDTVLINRMQYGVTDGLSTNKSMMLKSVGTSKCE